jgi:protein O-mannosyl-transferase
MAKKVSNKPPVKTVQKAAAAPRPEPKRQEAPKKKLSAKATFCIALAIVSLLVYVNTLRNGYVLDDFVVTTKNSIVTQGFKGIPELFATPRMKGVGYFKNDNYRPLSLAMFAAEYEMFGPTPAIGHFFNIVLFAGCVVLLFLFLDKFFDRKRTVVAFIASLLFALHPIHTEVVANIKSRDEILCFFFAFLSLNLFANYMRKGNILQLLAATVALFLSYISKETVVTFVVLVPLIFFFYLNPDRKRAIFITGGTLAATGAFLVIRHIVLSKYDCSTTAIEFIDNALSRSGAGTMVTASTAERFATPIMILGKYMRLLIVPYPLIDDYCYNSIPYVGFGNIWVLLSLAIYLAMGAAAVYRFIKIPKDPWAFSIIFFLATIALFSNIPFLIGSEMGERFVFFASIGFCLAAALAIEKWVAGGELSYPAVLKNTKVLALLIPVCLIFSVMTLARNSDWKDNYTLFKTDLQKQPNDSRLYFYLGDELVENIFPAEHDTLKKKQIIRESIDNLEQALRIFPDFPDAHTEAGNAYLQGGMLDSAAYHFNKAIAMSPYQSIAANNLGTVYLRQGKLQEAIKAYRLSLSINPGFAQAYFNLGGCLIDTKQYDSAVMFLNKALELNPGYTDAIQKIGLAYFQAKKYDMAEAYFKKAMEMNPNDVNAVNNLGAAYLNAGNIQQALEVFKKTVTMNPNYVAGYSNMAHCYFQLKQYEATIQTVNKALSLDPGDVKDIPYIALSYQAMGKMDLAKQYEAISQRYYPAFKLQ